MVFPEVCATPKHGIVGFIFVEFLQVRAEHPDGRIEPLQGGQDVHQQQFHGVPVRDVRFLVGQDGRAVTLPVFPGQHDVPHPAERDDIPVRDDDLAALLFPDRFPRAYQFDNGQDGHRHPYQHESDAGEEKDRQGKLPPGGRCRFRDDRGGSAGGRNPLLRRRLLHRLADRDDAQRQQERQHGRADQDDAVETVEGLLLQQETIEQVEDQQRHGHLAFINEERRHGYFCFSIRSMSSFSSSTEIFSSFTSAETTLI